MKVRLPAQRAQRHPDVLNETVHVAAGGKDHAHAAGTYARPSRAVVAPRATGRPGSSGRMIPSQISLTSLCPTAGSPTVDAGARVRTALALPCQPLCCDRCACGSAGSRCSSQRRSRPRASRTVTPSRCCPARRACRSIRRAPSPGSPDRWTMWRRSTAGAAASAHPYWSRGRTLQPRPGARGPRVRHLERAPGRRPAGRPDRTAAIRRPHRRPAGPALRAARPGALSPRHDVPTFRRRRAKRPRDQGPRSRRAGRGGVRCEPRTVYPVCAIDAQRRRSCKKIVATRIVSSEPLLDPTALELPFERQRRVALGASIDVRAARRHRTPEPGQRPPRAAQLAVVTLDLPEPAAATGRRGARLPGLGPNRGHEAQRPAPCSAATSTPFRAVPTRTRIIHARGWSTSLVEEDRRSTHHMGRIDYLFFQLADGRQATTRRARRAIRIGSLPRPRADFAWRVAVTNPRMREPAIARAVGLCRRRRSTPRCIGWLFASQPQNDDRSGRWPVGDDRRLRDRPAGVRRRSAPSFARISSSKPAPRSRAPIRRCRTRARSSTSPTATTVKAGIARTRDDALSREGAEGDRARDRARAGRRLVVDDSSSSDANGRRAQGRVASRA